MRPCILDTSELRQVKPPSGGVQVACLEEAQGLSGTLSDVVLREGRIYD